MRATDAARHLSSVSRASDLPGTVAPPPSLRCPLPLQTHVQRRLFVNRQISRAFRVDLHFVLSERRFIIIFFLFSFFYSSFFGFFCCCCFSFWSVSLGFSGRHNLHFGPRKLTNFLILNQMRVERVFRWQRREGNKGLRQVGTGEGKLEEELVGELALRSRCTN